LIELAKDLRLKPVYVVGHLHALWHAALEQQEDGDLSSWSDDLIAEASSYQGDAPQYVSLLQHHRWLDGKLLHDWLDYAGNYLSRKYHNSRRRYLQTLWLKHGRHYGKSTSLRKQKGRPDTGNLLSSSTLKSSEGGLGGPPGLPEWLDREVWESYRKHRAAMPKKNHLTPNAEKLAIEQLGKWAEMGQDPNEIVRRSIMNGWTGLFEIKNGVRGGRDPKKSAEPKGFAGIREILEREDKS
jgi:hypothetical protein